MARYLAFALLCLTAGCSTTGTPAPTDRAAADGPPAAAPAAPAAYAGPMGTLEADITSVLGTALPARIDLVPLDDAIPPQRFEAPSGRLETPAPAGSYRAYVHVYDAGVPVLAAIKDLTVGPGAPALLPINLLEGASGSLSLRSFDWDGDLAIDRVEIEAGTNREDAASVPSKPTLTWDSTVLQAQPRWYRGELQARSAYGGGTERVADLIARAERAGLDFLAITDRNTLAAARDAGFRSSRLVPIPAMEWGNDRQGVALIYGMRTEPDPPASLAAAQAECIRVQAQGGVFAVAHPCQPGAPWQWGTSYVNAVQVWHRDWRATPPLSLDQLDDAWKVREKGKLVYSIAAAAMYSASDIYARHIAVPYESVSANQQALKFWDYEMVHGLVAGAIGGSGANGPKAPLGRPITYIYAQNLSLPALIEGLRLGRTYVSRGPDGPTLQFTADVLADGTVDVGIGGIVPLNVEVQFEAIVAGAAGKKLQVMENGRPILSTVIDGPGYVHRFKRTAAVATAYRIQVVAEPDNPAEGFGPYEMHALSSPIFAQDIAQELLEQLPNIDPSKTWVRLRPAPTGAEMPEDLFDTPPPPQ